MSNSLKKLLLLNWKKKRFVVEKKGIFNSYFLSAPPSFFPTLFLSCRPYLLVKIGYFNCHPFSPKESTSLIPIFMNSLAILLGHYRLLRNPPCHPSIIKSSLWNEGLIDIKCFRIFCNYTSLMEWQKIIELGALGMEIYMEMGDLCLRNSR